MNPEYKASNLTTQPDIRSSSWINAKIREELGYAPNNVYLNSDDEKLISGMNDMEREMLILERNKKIETVRFKYEHQRKQFLLK